MLSNAPISNDFTSNDFTERLTARPVAARTAADRAIWLSQLKLSDFRIHQKLSLTLPSSAPIVLTGANGAGKTSLLEALSLLGPGRGLRMARNEKLMRNSDQRAGWGVAVKMCCEGEGINYHIGTGCAFKEDQLAPRRMRMNGRNISAAHLARHIRLFWLTPAMARLFGEKSERAERRRFIDRITMGFAPDHADHLIFFDRARKARQSVLAMPRPADQWLSALETQMAEHGSALTRARQEVIEKLNQHMEQLKPETFPAAKLSLEGDFESDFKNDLESDVENISFYRAELQKRRALDMAAGRATFGPHRADMVMTHLPSGLSAQHCSSGEVKALLTALVLAAARLATEHSNARAIILLDEIAAHLDIKRRYGLFAALADFPAQIWMTGTDRDIFAPLRMDAHFFTIAPGSAHPG